MATVPTIHSISEGVLQIVKMYESENVHIFVSIHVIPSMFGNQRKINNFIGF